MTKKDITVSVDEDTLQEIHANLDYGDSRSAWIRDAIEQKLSESSTVEATG